MSEHTKEPWRVIEWRHTAVVMGKNEGGFDLRDCPSPEANARRIVACVNACAEIPTDMLEETPYIGTVSYQLRMEAEAQRDELLAALEPFGAIDLVESRLPAEFAMLILRGRAAIAKVKGQP